MNDLFEKCGIKITETAISDLEKFYNILSENNAKFNLTAIRDKNEAFEKHFIDSLCGQLYFSSVDKILEIGSGGGFPSVPLKIADRSLDFTLIESTEKKCVYLKNVKELMGFDKFEVLNGRCEELINSGLRESFTRVTARAVAKLSVLGELCLPYLKVGGKAVFYKNYSPDEFEEGKKCIAEMGCKICEIKQYSLPSYEGKRAILIIEKVKSTPAKYPREYKNIIKKPIV